jgi:hypothetical protein
MGRRGTETTQPANVLRLVVAPLDGREAPQPFTNFNEMFARSRV